MNKRSSVCLQVALIISMLIFSGSMNKGVVADNGDSFFADFSFRTNSDKLPNPGAHSGSRMPEEKASSSPASRLYFSRYADQESLTIGKIFRARLGVDPAGQSINLVDSEILYSTSTLRLIEVDSEVSDFAMHLIGTKDSGSASLISMQPWPGIATSSIAVDLVFEVIASGEAEINFLPDSAVLANDGYGTNVLTEAQSIKLLIN